MRARLLAVFAVVASLPVVSLAFAQTAGDAPPPAASPPAATTATPPASTAPAKAPPPAPAAKEPAAPAAWKPPVHTFSPEFGLGPSVRLGSSSIKDVPIDQRYGLGMRLGMYYATNRTLSVGVAYNHSFGGIERNRGVVTNTYSVDRSIHAMLLEGRVHPFVRDSGRIFASLLLGGSYEHARAVGTFNETGSAATITQRGASCDGSGSPSIALGVGVGGEMELSDGWALISRGSFLGHRLSGEDIVSDKCRIPSAGTVATLEFHLAVAYRIDLDKANHRK